MNDTSLNSNIEWKKNKKGFGATEKITRKTNIKKALEYEAKEKKPLAMTKTPKPTDLPKGIKKLRKKIKEAYEEEGDEEYSDIIPLNMDSSLYNALYEDEKKQIQQQNTLKNQSMQQTAGKMEAVMQADRMAKEAGLKGIDKKIANKTTQNALHSQNILENIITEEASSKIKTGGKNLSPKETVTMLRGMERIKKISQAANESQLKTLEKMKVEEVLNAGEKSTNDKEVAELILKKSGRNNKKDVAKIVARSKENNKSKKPMAKPQKKSAQPSLTSRDIHRS